jgi:trimeric autotransporter adhesin
MRSRVFFAGVGVSLLALILISAGCGGGSNQAELRVVQASPDESSVNVLVDGTSVASVDYGAASSYLNVNSGTRHIQIEPTTSSTPIVDQNVSFASSAHMTMVVANLSPNIAGVVFTDNQTAPPSGDAQVRVINASPSLGTVDVYIVASGTGISNVTPTLPSLAFEGGSQYTSLAAATTTGTDYQIYFTIPNTKFVEATTGAISLMPGQNRTIVALTATGGGITTLTLADLD